MVPHTSAQLPSPPSYRLSQRYRTCISLFSALPRMVIMWIPIYASTGRSSSRSPRTYVSSRTNAATSAPSRFASATPITETGNTRVAPLCLAPQCLEQTFTWRASSFRSCRGSKWILGEARRRRIGTRASFFNGANHAWRTRRP